MPHLDFKYWCSSVLWILFCFCAVLSFSYLYVIPKIDQIIKSRKKRLDDNINILQDLNDEIQFLQQTYNSKISHAKAEFEKITKIEFANFSSDMQSRLKKIETENKKQIVKSTKLSESALNNLLAQHKESLVNTIKNKITSSLKK